MVAKVGCSHCVLIPQGSTRSSTFWCQINPYFSHCNSKISTSNSHFTLEVLAESVPISGIPGKMGPNFDFLMYFHDSLSPVSPTYLLPQERKLEATLRQNCTKCVILVKVNQLRVKNTHTKLGTNLFKYLSRPCECII